MKREDFEARVKEFVDDCCQEYLDGSKHEVTQEEGEEPEAVVTIELNGEPDYTVPIGVTQEYHSYGSGGYHEAIGIHTHEDNYISADAAGLWSWLFFQTQKRLREERRQHEEHHKAGQPTELTNELAALMAELANKNATLSRLEGLREVLSVECMNCAALRAEVERLTEEIAELRPIAAFANRALSEIAESSDPAVAVHRANARALAAEAALERARQALREEKESRRKIEAHLLWGRNILSGILYEPAGGAAQAECLAAARLWLPGWVDLNAALPAPAAEQVACECKELVRMGHSGKWACKKCGKPAAPAEHCPCGGLVVDGRCQLVGCQRYAGKPAAPAGEKGEGK